MARRPRGHAPDCLCQNCGGGDHDVWEVCPRAFPAPKIGASFCTRKKGHEGKCQQGDEVAPDRAGRWGK